VEALAITLSLLSGTQIVMGLDFVTVTVRLVLKRRQNGLVWGHFEIDATSQLGQALRTVCART